MIKFASALGERRPEEVVSWQMTLTLPSSMSSSCKVINSVIKAMFFYLCYIKKCMQIIANIFLLQILPMNKVKMAMHGNKTLRRLENYDRPSDRPTN